MGFIISTAGTTLAPVPEGLLTFVEPLRKEQTAEVLAFLAARPIQTVAMTGFILQNGIDSPLNRGAFYGYRNPFGRLEGVALIGHTTLFEALTDEALRNLARFARSQPLYMVMAERVAVEQFWRYFAEATGDVPRLICRTVMMQRRLPVMEPWERMPELRPATAGDLEQLVKVNARIIEDSHGVNPLRTDAAGFTARCLRRIEQGRTWVWMKDGELIFKADVMAEAHGAVYLEGIHVTSKERCKGYGLRCITQLAGNLESRAHTICALVALDDLTARAFYTRAGYSAGAEYATFFLKQNAG